MIDKVTGKGVIPLQFAFDAQLEVCLQAPFAMGGLLGRTGVLGVADRVQHGLARAAAGNGCRA